MASESDNAYTAMDFPLQLCSKDQVSIGDENEVLATFLTEEFKIHLKLLKLASKPFTSKEDLNNLGKVSPDIVNRLDQSQGAAPLHYASMHGNLPMVAFLLENGADTDILDDNKRVTPLACAAAYGHLEVVKVLLASNCDVDSGLNNKNPDHRIPLVWAIKGNHPEIVQCLLDSSASQNSPILYAETPIHAGVVSGSPEIIQMLIKAQGANIRADSQMGAEGDTPLHLAASGIYPNSLEACKVLVEQGNVQINALNINEKTPLHEAAASQNADTVKFLLSHWAKVNAVDKDGKTPLFYAIGDSECALSCMETLIKIGKCDVNHQDNQGNTALHTAALYGAANAAELLMINGADFSIKAGHTSALSILRRKIPEVREVLARVFDHAVSATSFHESGGKDTRHDCKVKVNYKYVLPSNHQLITSPGSPSEDQQIKRNGTGGPRMAFLFKSTNEEDRGLQAKAGRKETSKIKCLVDEDLACLLTHPVVESFLELKWTKARRIFFPTLIFKAILVLLFSAYVEMPYVFNGRLIGMQHMAIPTSNATNQTMAMMMMNCSVPMMSAAVSKTTTPPPPPPPLPSIPPPTWFKVMYVAIVTMATIKGLMELMQILRAPKTQLRTVHPYLSLAVLVIMIGYMRPAIWKRSADQLTRSVAALGILLAWMDIWIDSGRFPQVGLSIRVFFQVLKNFAKFMMPHFCLMAGFVLSFTLLFPTNPEFSGIAFTLTKIIRVMAGDITIVTQGQRMLLPDTPTSELLAHVLLVYIYTAYVLIVAIVLGNLLIGLAVNDIQGIYAGASVDKLAKETILINTLESNFGGKWSRNWVPKGVLIKYTNLFHPSSQTKILTFKPYDSRDSKLSKEQKLALLNIANVVKVTTDSPSKEETEEVHDIEATAPVSKHIQQWRAVAKKVRKSHVDEDQKVLMEKISELLSKFIADKQAKN